jgi:hypothetical protein
MGGAATKMELGEISSRLTALPERIEADAVLLRRGRVLNATCQLSVGANAFLLRIVDGRVHDVRRGPLVTPSADFTIAGDATVWRRFLAASPPPGDHDLFAFVKRRELQVTGDLHPLMSHLLYWKGLFGHLRAEPAP